MEPMEPLEPLVEPLEPVRDVGAAPSKKPRAKKRKAEIKDPVPIHLFPSQQEHVAKMNATLDKHPFALDFSMLGAGKTYTTTFLAQQRGIKNVMVIAPISVLTKWTYMKETHGLNVVDLISYQSLRSQKCKQPKHGFLERRDYRTTTETGEIIEHVDFTPTERFEELVKEGLMLVVDEIQNIKNVSSQFNAVQALVWTITTSRAWAANPSRVVFLSGSPIDKQEHALHLFRALGIMRADRVAQMNPQTFQLEWTGMQEIYDWCLARDKVKATAVRAAQPANIRDVGFQRFAYQLFQQVMKPAVSAAMLPPKPLTHLFKRNAYYHVSDADYENLKSGVEQLKKAASFNGANGTVNFTAGAGGVAGAMSGITRAMLVIETGKINTFARIAAEALDALPQQKVVICVNYTDTINDLQRLLWRYNPLVLNGGVSLNQRLLVLEQFQSPSTEHRLLLGNVEVCNSGIDLDDKHGEYPRLALVSPNYSILSLYQLGHRFQRADTRSDAAVHFVFGKKTGARSKDASPESIELKVLDALSKKSQIMKETTTEQAEMGVVFPGDYATFEE